MGRCVTLIHDVGLQGRGQCPTLKQTNQNTGIIFQIFENSKKLSANKRKFSSR